MLELLQIVSPIVILARSLHCTDGIRMLALLLWWKKSRGGGGKEARCLRGQSTSSGTFTVQSNLCVDNYRQRRKIKHALFHRSDIIHAMCLQRDLNIFNLRETPLRLSYWSDSCSHCCSSFPPTHMSQSQWMSVWAAIATSQEHEISLCVTHPGLPVVFHPKVKNCC